MATDKRLDQVKLVNSAESVLVVNGDQVEKATLAGFANSMGSSVPLQQTSEQVSITGLYARTSDGKMVELTKESVASVMAGLTGRSYVTDMNSCVMNGESGMVNGETLNLPETFTGVGVYNVARAKYASNNSLFLVQTVMNETGTMVFKRECWNNKWHDWLRIDNFGYNTLAELSSGVAQQMGVKFKGYTTVKSGESLTLTSTYGFCFLTSNQDKHVFFHQTYSGRIDIIFQTDQNGDYTNVKDTEGRVNLYKSDNDKLVIQNKSSKDYGIYWIMFGV